MLVLITYDVSTQDTAGSRRLRNVAKACEAHGQRVQYSVFECLLTDTQFRKLRHQLEQLIDTQTDSLRFYLLGNRYDNRVIHVGAKSSYSFEETLMV